MFLESDSCSRVLCEKEDRLSGLTNYTKPYSLYKPRTRRPVKEKDSRDPLSFL
jgi:hypothetical protein